MGRTPPDLAGRPGRPEGLLARCPTDELAARHPGVLAAALVRHGEGPRRRPYPHVAVEPVRRRALRVGPAVRLDVPPGDGDVRLDVLRPGDGAVHRAAADPGRAGSVLVPPARGSRTPGGHDRRPRPRPADRRVERGAVDAVRGTARLDRALAGGR